MGVAGDDDPRMNDLRREEMKAPDEVTAMVKLKELGWGTKRIARELGCSRNTVKRWLSCGSWGPYAEVSRSRQLEGLSEWLAERFRRHGGNADVIRQELATEAGVSVSLRTVERAVAPLRQELLAEARATVRFETSRGTAADRLWRTARGDRWQPGEGVLVCCHARLFAPAARASLRP